MCMWEFQMCLLPGHSWGAWMPCPDNDDGIDADGDQVGCSAVNQYQPGQWRGLAAHIKDGG